MGGSREKFRAVFFSFVMVVSIMGAGVAFTGSAAAVSPNSASVSSDGEAALSTATVKADAATDDSVVSNELQKVIVDFGTDANFDGNLDAVDSSDVTVSIASSDYTSGQSISKSGGQLTVTLDSAQSVSDGNTVAVDIADFQNPSDNSDGPFDVDVTLEDSSGNQDGPVTPTYSISAPSVSEEAAPTKAGDTVTVNVDNSEYSDDDEITAVHQYNDNENTLEDDGASDYAADFTAAQGSSNTIEIYVNGVNVGSTSYSADYLVQTTPEEITHGAEETISGEIFEYYVEEGSADNVLDDGDHTVSLLFSNGGSSDTQETQKITSDGTFEFTNTFDQVDTSPPTDDQDFPPAGTSLSDLDGGTEPGYSAVVDGTTPTAGDGGDVLNVRLNSEITSDTTSLEYGDGSVAVEGVLEDAGDSPIGVGSYGVQLSDASSSSVGSSTTSSDGSYGFFADLTDDAGEYDLQTSTGSAVDYQTVTVDSGSVAVSSDTDTATSNIGETEGITVDINDDSDLTDSTSGYDARMNVSGVEIEKINDLADGLSDSSATISYIELADGSTLGAYPDGSDHGTSFDAGNNDDTNAVKVVFRVDSGDVSVDEATESFTFDALFAEAGEVNIEGQLENTDTDTPTSPDLVGTDSLTVESAGGLNVGGVPSTLNVNNSGSQNSDDVVLSIQDQNGEGVKSSENPSDDTDIVEATINLNATGTEMGLDEDLSFSNGGPKSFESFDNNLGSSEITVNYDDLSGATTDFTIQNLRAEQNGTIDVTVTATYADDSTSEVTKTIDVVGHNVDTNVESLSADDVADLAVNVSDDSGTPRNSRTVKVAADPTSADAVFNVSTDGGSTYYDAAALALDGGQDRVHIYTSAPGAFDTDWGAGDADYEVVVNNGEYEFAGASEIDNITFSSVADHQVWVDNDGIGSADQDEVYANLQKQISVAGVDAYDITSDIDPVLAGQDEQINLTVTENGETVNGSELVTLAGNTEIDQQTNAVDDVSGPSAEDTDGDNTEDVIQATINADESGTAAVNVSLNNGDNTKSSETSIGVVQPDFSTNLTGDLTLGLTSSNVEITAEDPRDGTALQDSDLRLTATNATFDVDASDGSNIIDDTGSDSFDSSSTSIVKDADNDKEVSLDENGTAVVDISTQENNAGDQPITLDLTVENDSDGNYFGDASLGVGELSFVDAPDEQDPNTDYSQTFQLVDANDNGVDLASLQISGTGLDGNSRTKVTSDGFVNFDYTTSDSGTIDLKILNSNDLAVNSNNNEFTVKSINVLEQANLTLNASATDIQQGDSVDFTLERDDFEDGIPTSGTLTITNASDDVVDTVSIDETATVTFDEAGDFTVTASKPTQTQTGKSFQNDTVDVAVEAPAEPGAVQLDNVNLDPNSVDANTTNDHDLTFDALNVSADNSTDSFEVSLPSDSLDSANDVTVTTENVSAQNLAVNGDTITFDVNPDSEDLSTDIAVEANVTVTSPDVSSTTDASIDINATDSDGSSDSQSATLTVTPADVELGDLAVSLEPQNVTANEETDVTVTVTNQSSGDAVEGASVSISDLQLSNTTDADGEATFTVNASQTGQYPVDVSADGFTDASATITVEEDSTAISALIQIDLTADRDVQTSKISLFSEHHQSAPYTRLPHDVYNYTRTHNGELR